MMLTRIEFALEPLDAQAWVTLVKWLGKTGLVFVLYPVITTRQAPTVLAACSVGMCSTSHKLADMGLSWVLYSVTYTDRGEAAPCEQDRNVSMVPLTSKLLPRYNE